jgi:hypothetical protein
MYFDFSPAPYRFHKFLPDVIDVSIKNLYFGFYFYPFSQWLWNGFGYQVRSKKDFTLFFPSMSVVINW